MQNKPNKKVTYVYTTGVKAAGFHKLGEYPAFNVKAWFDLMGGLNNIKDFKKYNPKDLGDRFLNLFRPEDSETIFLVQFLKDELLPVLETEETETEKKVTVAIPGLIESRARAKGFWDGSVVISSTDEFLTTLIEGILTTGLKITKEEQEQATKPAR